MTNHRKCTVCGAAYQRRRGESTREWRFRATCGRNCGKAFGRARLGTYPTPLLDCASCGEMKRAGDLNAEAVCAECAVPVPVHAVVAYAATPEGRAFILGCREPRPLRALGAAR